MFYLQVLGFAPTITLHNGMDLKEEPVHCYDVGDSHGDITTMCGGDLTGTEIIKHCDHNVSEIPAVTVEQAIQCLITVIHYLQAHPPGQDIQILFDLLDFVNKQASHAAVERGLQANSNDQANDIHNLQIHKTCKGIIKIEPVAMMEYVEQMDLKEEPVHSYDVGYSCGEITTRCGDLTGADIVKHCDHNSSETPVVTVKEAIQGLITVIHYLQAHPPGQDIQILFDLLDFVNKHASHAAVERGLQANSNDQTNDIHNLQIHKTCKGIIKIEPVAMMESAEQMHDSSDVTSLEHGTHNVRFKRKTSQKDVNTSTICATHDAIPEQLEPDVLISSQHERIANELSEELLELHANQDAITLRGNDRNIINGVSVSSLDYLLDSHHERTEHIEDEAHCKNKIKTSPKAFKCGEEMSKQIHQCKICDFQCENPKKLYDHAINGHSKYNCKECGRSSASKAGLVRHMLRHRNKKLQESNIGDIVDNTKKTSSLYQCKSCDFQCEERKELWDHKLSHSGYVCNECGYICRYKSIFDKHMKMHERNVSLGRSPMPQKTILSRQKSTSYVRPKDMFHIDKKMQFYKCKLCDYHCANRRKARYHAESHRDYTCKICDKKCVSKCTLDIHVRLHNKEPLLPCQYCKQGFKDAEQLTEHLKIHSGKSIVCDVSVVCGEC